MLIRNPSYNIEHFIIEGLNRGLLENDIVKFYQDQGFNVFYSKDYVSYINGEDWDNPFLNVIKSNEAVKCLFSKYNNGYPDILIVREDYAKFIEIKLDGDSIRPNQVLFLEELSSLIPTSLVFFNNLERSKGIEEIHKSSSFNKVDRVVLNQIEYLISISKKVKFKPFWVVAKLYEQFGYRILKKSIISVLSKSINEPKDKIVWFIKENLDKTNAGIRYKRYEEIKKKKRKRKPK